MDLPSNDDSGQNIGFNMAKWWYQHLRPALRQYFHHLTGRPVVEAERLARPLPSFLKP